MVAKNGHLILAANTLGTLDQLPEITCEQLRKADLVIFEEDRPARQTLKRAGIHRDYLKYNEHKPAGTLAELTATLQQGATAIYMSDQGMPNIADPGRELLAAAYRLGAQVTVIPGACSVTAALAACPVLSGQYLFYGFLPRETGPRREEIGRLLTLAYPAVILETPYRYRPLIADLAATAPKSTRVLLAVDIAGPGQGFHWLTVGELEDHAERVHKKLNFVLVLCPPAQSGPAKGPRGQAKRPRSQAESLRGAKKRPQNLGRSPSRPGGNSRKPG